MGISSPLVDLQHQYDLLQKEYEYEKETYRQQSERTGLRKRVAQGLCWYPVTPGRSYYNSLNQLVIEIERTEDREISLPAIPTQRKLRENWDGKHSMALRRCVRIPGDGRAIILTDMMTDPLVQL